jgi:hypothetical protein
MSVRPRGPLPGWQPRDEVGRAVLADLLDRLAQHETEDTLPRSPRGLFYDLRPGGFGRGITYIKHPPMRRVGGGQLRRVNPMDASGDNVQEILVKARRAGLVDEDWIDDGHAPTPALTVWDDASAEDIAAHYIESIRDPQLEYDPQTGQPVYLEALAEAAGLIGRCERIAAPYGVNVYSGAGYDGLKGKRAFAERARLREVPTVVLRITDWDHDGRVMARACTEDSEAWARHLGAPDGWLSFERIALTEDQARLAGLLDADGHAEAEGLPVPVMDAILREAIERYQDPAIREQTTRHADAERARITGLILDGLNGRHDD